MTSDQPNLDASVYLKFTIKTWKDQGNYIIYVVCCMLYWGRFNRPTYSSSTIYVGILKSIIFQKESCKEMMESFKVIFVSIQSLTLSIRFIRVEESFNRRQQDTAPAWDELISIFLKSQTKI